MSGFFLFQGGCFWACSGAMCVRSTADTFWQRSAARSSRAFTALWTWRWSASIRGRTARRRWRSWLGVEHYLLSRPAHGHRRQRPAQRKARQRRGGTGRGERVFHDGCAAGGEYLIHVLFSGHPKPGAAFFVSVARGLVISGALILLLPAVLWPASIWWAMPVTELLVACCAAAAMRRATRALPPC